MKLGVLYFNEVIEKQYHFNDKRLIDKFVQMIKLDLFLKNDNFVIAKNTSILTKALT